MLMAVLRWLLITSWYVYGVGGVKGVGYLEVLVDQGHGDFPPVEIADRSLRIAV
jgi:hypothetical protein